MHGRAMAAGCVLVLLASCGDARDPEDLDLGSRRDEDASSPEPDMTRARRERDDGPGRLAARPRTQVHERGKAGLQEITVTRPGDAILYIPPSYRPSDPAPFALLLHGAGGRAPAALSQLRPYADEFGTILLAVKSRGPTWDVIIGGLGPDVAFIDRLLARTFQSYAIDPQRVAVGGFSDGASYALTLGIINGDLFTHVLAFSPGFAAPGEPHGRPRIFISHGTDDPVLPIDQTSRKLVPRLKRAGYTVVYEEFAGGHTVPAEIAERAARRFAR